MGIDLSFYWPGQTRESLAEAGRVGPDYNARPMDRALSLLQRYCFPGEDVKQPLCDRYNLHDLCTLQAHPGDVSPGEFEETWYRRPEDLAAAAERLAGAVAARDPDAEFFVEAHSGLGEPIVTWPPVTFADRLRRFFCSRYYREPDVVYPANVTLSDEDWQICHDDLLAFAAHARRVADLGVELATPVVRF